MQTDEHTSWVLAAAIRPDDRVRPPYGSRRAIVAVGERGGIPLYLSWIRGEERYARA